VTAARRVTRRLLASILVLLALALPAGSALAQEATTTVPEATTTPTRLPPTVGEGLDGDGSSPLVYVALSLLGGATAVSIMAVQWIRTRPR
jgi:hypothetical protein